MRVTPLQTDRTFLTNIGSLNEKLDLTNRQISSGKKLLSLKDSPEGSAEMIGLRKGLDDIDQYRANADIGNLYQGVADSAMSSVHTLVTSIFTRGSEATSGIVDDAGRAALATEIRTLRDQVLSLANSNVQGRYIFAGSQTDSPAFSIAGDTVTYNGDQVTNKISVGDGVEVQQGLAGDGVFSPLFAMIGQLLTAVDTGDGAGIQAALGQFSGGLSALNQTRVQLGVDQNTLLDARNRQDSIELSIKSREQTLQGADIAEAITQLQQIQTALQVSLSAHSSTRRMSLFDYLG